MQSQKAKQLGLCIVQRIYHFMHKMYTTFDDHDLSDVWAEKIDTKILQLIKYFSTKLSNETELALCERMIDSLLISKKSTKDMERRNNNEKNEKLPNLSVLMMDRIWSISLGKECNSHSIIHKTIKTNVPTSDRVTRSMRKGSQVPLL